MAYADSDAHLVWPLPVGYKSSGSHTRGTLEPFPTALPLATHPANGAPRESLPLARSCPARLHWLRAAHTGGCIHVASAEDDADTICRPQAISDERDDAMDDARHVRLLHHVLPQRPRPLLGDVQRHRHRHAGLHLRLGQPQVLPAQVTGAGEERARGLGGSVPEQRGRSPQFDRQPPARQGRKKENIWKSWR